MIRWQRVKEAVGVDRSQDFWGILEAKITTAQVMEMVVQAVGIAQRLSTLPDVSATVG